jgi:hypothetical protein
MAGRVDYRTAATVYERGRALTTGDLQHWKDAISAIVPPDVGTVLDLGAGLLACATRRYRLVLAASWIICRPVWPSGVSSPSRHGPCDHDCCRPECTNA